MVDAFRSSSVLLFPSIRPSISPALSVLGRGRLLALFILSLTGVGPLGGCSEGDGSITLVFPNDVARSAVRRLRVEAYSPDSGGTGLSDRSCSDFLGQARLGMEPLGAPVRGDYQCAEPCPDGWFADESLAQVPSGRQIIYVLAYASSGTDQMPILEGCTDTFNSTEEAGSFEGVRVDLQFVVPDNARLVIVGGDRQVGRAETTLGLPLEVEVRADAPIADRAQYVIPGLPITFSAQTDGYAIVGSDGAVTGPLTIPANLDGQASTLVRVASVPGNGTVDARASVLEDIPNATPAVQFSISVTPSTQFPQREVIQQPGGWPVGMVLGSLDGPGPADLITLTCEGTSEQCTLAPIVENPGRTRLTVIRDVASENRRPLAVPPALGLLPTDVRAVDMLPNSSDEETVQEVAILNARRESCQTRTCPVGVPCACFGLAANDPCPCEGSEIRLLRIEPNNPDALEVAGAYTLTASNAVGMGVLSRYTGEYDGLVVAARGRLRNDRPCRRPNQCDLPNAASETPSDRAFCEAEPQSCGCPQNEFCECPDAETDPSTCFCRAEDEILDVLAVRTPGASDLFNQGGCQSWIGTCGDSDVDRTCECLDASERGGVCTASDRCGCPVPKLVQLGEQSGRIGPVGVVAGPLRPGQSDDIVVPSIGGLALAQSDDRDLFQFIGIPLVNEPIHEARVAQLDEAAEQLLGGLNIAPDIVWVAREACTEGFETQCPQVDANESDARRRGCLGVYYTDGEPSVLRLNPPAGQGGCRRHALTYAPDGLCTGNFNADQHIDVAVAAAGVTDVMVFNGDGRGGLLDPPELVALGALGGGPLACDDLDGDGLDDIAVLTTDAEGRAAGVVLLKSRP